MAHTPGPWLSHPRSDGITAVYKWTAETANDLVASMSPTQPEAEANARLIAAAPEMLEALEEAQYALGCARDSAAALNGETCSDARYFAEQKAIVMHAIRKAKGE